MTEAPLPKKKDYSITSDKNNKFYVEIYSDSNYYLNVVIKTIEKIPTITYEEKFSLETIKKNNYFLMCKNMNDVLITLEPNIKNTENMTLLEETNELNLIVTLPHPLCPEIVFKVKTKKRDFNEIINELYELINKQNILINEKENQIKLLNQNFENLKTIINEQNDKINKQNNEIKNLEEKLKKIEEDNKKIFETKKDEEVNLKNPFLSKNSKIILNDNQKEEAIKEWINPNKKITFSLLYRMSRDGENPKDFHKNCDNKGPTLILAETTKGYKIGGYTSLDWETSDSGKSKYDEDTFLFSLNQMKKYTKKNNSYSIYMHKDYAIYFGEGTDLGIGHPELSQGWSCNKTFLTNKELTNGESSFILKEVEVFKVEFS